MINLYLKIMLIVKNMFLLKQYDFTRLKMIIFSLQFYLLFFKQIHEKYLFLQLFN
jgi:hypothetical protein